MDEKYKHDYKLTPNSQTPHIERNLHYDHRFAMNEAREYLHEFRDLDYEDFMGISRVKFILQQNVFERGNKATINVIERVGRRLKALPDQDIQIRALTQKIRNLWSLLLCGGVYYSSSGKQRDDNRKKFYEILVEFKKRN